MAEEVNIGELWIDISAEAGLEQVRNAINIQREEIGKLDGIFKNIKTAAMRFVAVYATYEAFNRTIIGAANRYAEREKSLLRLEAVLSSHNIKSEEVRRIYFNLAEAIKNTTRHTTEQAMAAEEILTTMGVGPALMEQALEATVRLSVRNGSLEQSAQILGQALSGNTRQIGILVTSLRGMKDINADTIFKEIEKVYGNTAKAEMEGYIGQTNQLRKQYDDFLLKISAGLIPAVTWALKKINKANPESIIYSALNPYFLLQRLAMQEVINAYGKTQWVGSVGYQKNPNVLLQADKAFVANVYDERKKAKDKSMSFDELRDLWIKAEAERYAEADDLNTKWFTEQKKAARESYDLNIKTLNEIVQLDTAYMQQSWAIKDQQYKIINDAEMKVINEEIRGVYEAVDTISRLAPSSSGFGKGLSNIADVLTGETDWQKRLQRDKRRYQSLVEAYRFGLVSQGELDLEKNKIAQQEKEAEILWKLDLIQGNLDMLSGIAEMIYEMSGDKTAFYIFKALQVASTTFYTIKAAKKAYDIGEKIPYAGEYLKWVFMAIAIAVGLARVAMIVATNPGNSVQVPARISTDLDYKKELLMASTEKKKVSPVLHWYVFDTMNTNRDFARELLPYVQEARGDMVH